MMMTAKTMRRWAALGLVWVFGFGFGLLGQTWGAFSATTANTGNTFQAAASFCTSPGSQTVYSNIDSLVAEAAPTVNFGTDANNFGIRSSSSGDARSFVRFNLPAIPAGCTVTAATLRLYTSAGVTGRTLQAFRVSGNWTETGVTWNNQPGTTGAAATAPSVASGWVPWTVTTMVQAMYSGTNYGFLVRDSVENSATTRDQAMHPRENTNDPRLIVTFG
jgi:large repetitive protein